jgi:hypothetical protein
MARREPRHEAEVATRSPAARAPRALLDHRGSCSFLIKTPPKGSSALMRSALALREHGDPVDQLAGCSLAQPRARRRTRQSPDRPARRRASGWCTRTMRSMQLAASGKSMKWNTHRRRKASGSSFSLLLVMITTGRCRARSRRPSRSRGSASRSSSCSRSFGNSRSALSTSSISRTTRFGDDNACPSGPELDVAADVLHVGRRRSGCRTGAAPCRRRRGRLARGWWTT